MSKINRPITIDEMVTGLPDEVRNTIAALKAENERLLPYEETYKHYEQENSTLRVELEKVKVDFSEALKIGYDQQADLEKVRPLIEAVMGANLFPAPTDGRTCIDSHDKIIRAALALREEKK